jgi:hypothetical protein
VIIEPPDEERYKPSHLLELDDDTTYEINESIETEKM